jgi:hypothetical protein
MWRSPAAGTSFEFTSILEPLEPWNGQARRQDVAPLLTPNGTLYLTTREGLTRYRRLFPPRLRALATDQIEGIDVDTETGPGEAVVQAGLAKPAGGRVCLGAGSASAAPGPPARGAIRAEPRIAHNDASDPAFERLVGGAEPVRFGSRRLHHIPPGEHRAAPRRRRACSAGRRADSWSGSSLGVGLGRRCSPERADGRRSAPDYPATERHQALRRDLPRPRRSGGPADDRALRRPAAPVGSLRHAAYARHIDATRRRQDAARDRARPRRRLLRRTSGREAAFGDLVDGSAASSALVWCAAPIPGGARQVGRCAGPASRCVTPARTSPSAFTGRVRVVTTYFSHCRLTTRSCPWSAEPLGSVVFTRRRRCGASCGARSAPLPDGVEAGLGLVAGGRAWARRSAAPSANRTRAYHEASRRLRASTVSRDRRHALDSGQPGARRTGARA